LVRREGVPHDKNDLGVIAGRRNGWLARDGHERQALSGLGHRWRLAHHMRSNVTASHFRLEVSRRARKVAREHSPGRRSKPEEW